MNIASISGGKDSTAMLIILHDNGIKLSRVIYVNTGIEFPQTIQYIKNKLNPWVMEHFGISITVVRPEKPFAFLVREYGVPFAPAGRWCCRLLKEEPFYKYLHESGITEADIFLGYTKDEERRFERAKKTVKRYENKYGVKVTLHAPLIEHGITGKEALEMTREHGLYNELYDHFSRTGCYLCPYQSLDDWRNLYWNFPELFNAAKKLEEISIKLHGKTFRRDYTLSELEERFRREGKQTKLWW